MNLVNTVADDQTLWSLLRLSHLILILCLTEVYYPTEKRFREVV